MNPQFRAGFCKTGSTIITRALAKELGGTPKQLSTGLSAIVNAVKKKNPKRVKDAIRKSLLLEDIPYVKAVLKKRRAHGPKLSGSALRDYWIGHRVKNSNVSLTKRRAARKLITGGYREYMGLPAYVSPRNMKLRLKRQFLRGHEKQIKDLAKQVEQDWDF